MKGNVPLKRVKSVEFLEKLVQCPVCRGRPADRVLMCTRGHNMCQSCTNQLSKCPTCRGGLSGLRNFAMEELCTQVPDITSLLLEPWCFNSTAMMTPSTSSESIAMQTDVPMIRCRIGSCPELLPADCVYPHVRLYHIKNVIKMNTRQQSDGSSYSKIHWELKYELNKFYDYALYTEELGLFFVNFHINEEGDLLAALRMANPQRDEKLYYEMTLYVPDKDAPEKFKGIVQDCSIISDKYFQACKYKKRFFACYFEADFATLNDLRVEPFTLSLQIHLPLTIRECFHVTGIRIL